MKATLQLLFILLVSLTFTMVANAYPETWTNFDASQLEGASEQTLGNTQNLLNERGGSIECIACHGETEEEYEGVMSTTEIANATMEAAMNCLDWEVRGICVWMTCVLAACEFDYSIKVRNFVPDLTMQAYDRANGEPWTESQDLNEISQGDTESSWVLNLIELVEDYNVSEVGIRGGVSTEAKKDQHSNLSFKLVDAYGNPAIEAFNSGLSSTGYICEGSPTMLFPYFVSNLDAIAWRWDIPEMFYPMSFLPLLSIWDLGNEGQSIYGVELAKANNYGPIYPRHGFMTAQDPLKSAVLAIFRAAHVITRDSEPHLYWDIQEDEEPGWWPPEPLDQEDKYTGQFQMLYPNTEDSCRSFPYGKNPEDEERSEDGSYIWNFWRAYKCCEQEGAVLIFHSG